MTRSTVAAELNTFVAGLVTEATPLTFPANASVDEDNFILNRTGSRQRRLGMDLEEGHVDILTTVVAPTSGEVAVSFHRWSNVSGIANKNILVVQVGDEIKFFDQDAMPLSSGLVHTHKFVLPNTTTKFSYAVVDGSLVVAVGEPNLYIFDFSSATQLFSVRNSRLKIRDMFGVEDVLAGVNLRDGNGVTIRPASLTPQHAYNLRNQTWAEPRKPISLEFIADPIDSFVNVAGKFPANSDAVTYALYPDANDGDDRLTERFIAQDLYSNPVGTFPAPKGYFIIDALSRGSSRVSEYADLLSRNTSLGHSIGALPADTTMGGASVITEYAGRVWYAGFSGNVVDGDAHSPRLASYILFSQLVEDPTDITKCYQDGDPTSKEEPDLIDTDGGFIRIDGAYGIVGLVNVGSAVMVVAANGVWMIQGGSDYGFKATNYLVTKITNRGCEAPDSIVVIDNTFMYWADDGIYTVAPNQYGDYEAQNVSRKTIQTLFDNIPSTERMAARGVYDTYEQKVRWVYANRLFEDTNVRELVLDTTLGAFYTNTLGKLDTDLPKVIGGFTIPPIRTGIVEEDVTVDGVDVTASGIQVYVEAQVQVPNAREVMYLAVTNLSGNIRYSFSAYTEESFSDWKSVDGVGIDARAYLLTGWAGGEDFQRYKQVPYVTFHFNKTEDGFEEDGIGDWVPTSQSSCRVSARWEWANHANSGQWGRSFQAYRFKRHYIPADISDPFNNGYQTVVTKNKLRGKGRVVSLFIETEPAKDCQLLGWSIVMSANGNV
ncbi:hypothetical protein D3C85_167250 [compost metagenome]